jgi:MerR family transcriptional regulator, thiopeptide resistance regulator
LWWRGMTANEKAEWKQRSQQLGEDWMAAATAGIAPDSAEAQALAKRHVEWLTGIPGTPASDVRGNPDARGGGGVRQYVAGLGEMYVADARFAKNYGGAEGARFVRDALEIYAEQNL